MRAGFRACYNQGLAQNPDMSGSVRVTATIGPNGEVRSANASPSGSISGAVASCIASRVRSAQFDPPEGGAATVVIPVTLVQQK
jgi:TonB family protein